MNTPGGDLPHFDAAARPFWKFERPRSAGSGLGKRLVEVHDHIRQETGKLLEAVAGVVGGRVAPEAARSALKALSLRQNYPGLGGFCTGYCELLHIHHTLEDTRVFPGLGVAHPELNPVLKQLYAEHEVVAELILRLDETLAAGEDARGRLAHVSRRLADQLLSHLAYEESQLVEVLESTPGQPGGPPAS